MKVEHIDNLALDCGCDPADYEEQELDPYRVTARDGKTFVVCDRHFKLVKDILQAEGIAIQGVEHTPAGQQFWRTV